MQGKLQSKHRLLKCTFLVGRLFGYQDVHKNSKKHLEWSNITLAMSACRTYRSVGCSSRDYILFSLICWLPFASFCFSSVRPQEPHALGACNIAAHSKLVRPSLLRTLLAVGGLRGSHYLFPGLASVLTVSPVAWYCLSPLILARSVESAWHTHDLLR